MPHRVRVPRPGRLIPRLALLVGGMTLSSLLWPSTGHAAGVRRTVPLQPAAVQPASTGKLSPDLLQLAGRLRSIAPGERARLSRLRASHTELPVFRATGPEASYIQVYLTLTDVTPETLKALQEEGVLIQLVQEEESLVQGFVRLDDLECLADLTVVQSITRPNYSICNSMQEPEPLYQGKYGEETQDFMDLAELRQAGLDGSGVTIGVLSVGLFDSIFGAEDVFDPFGNYADKRVVSGDLPLVDPNGFQWDFGGIFFVQASDSLFYHETIPVINRIVPPHPDWQPGLPEGDFYQQRPVFWRVTDDRERANAAVMYEIVYDMAPKAQLLFGPARTDVEFHLSRESLLQPGYRTGVIVDDVAFAGIGRYDGTSPLSKRATEIVRDNNIVYVTAVGDYTPPETGATEAVASGKPLFINTFFNPDPRNTYQKFHGFNHPTESYRDETLEIEVDPELGFFEAFLVWDDTWVNDKYYTENPIKEGAHGRATDDIDMYVVDTEIMDITTPIAASTFNQDGRSRNPYERIVVGNTGRNMSLLIRRRATFDNRPTFMTLVITAGVVLEPQYLTHGVPLCNSDAIGGVISVGALGSPELIENFTVPGYSPGPGASKYKRFLQWRPGEQKPDICVQDRIATYTGEERSPLGGINFRGRSVGLGTSAAAAHVGGFCALLRQAFPEVPASQYHEILTRVGVDPLTSNAVPILTEISALYGNAPVYLRLEPANVISNPINSTAQTLEMRYDLVENPGLWTSGPTSDSPFALPQFEYADGHLILRSTQHETFGYWESPILVYIDPDTETPSTLLDADRLYRVRLRIGSDQDNANTVPDFRLRLITSSADEVAEIVVNSMTPEGTNAPTVGEPRDYLLYYQPTPEAASFGVRVAVDMINFSTRDDPNGAIYIHEVELEELAFDLAQ